jgi:MoaA/NifB/PqqE/SkfB family radical SAM enzyme
MCPNGGVSGLINNSKGLMSQHLFRRIIDKCTKEKSRITTLVFGNWGEPLLNPELPAMIKYARANLRSPHVGVMTNLNYLQNPIELINSGVDEIVISISGMTQEIYQKNHIGGNIKVVLDNVLKLADIRNKGKFSRPVLKIKFHDFIYNKNDQELTRKFCNDNQLAFILRRMYVHSVEDNICFQEDKERFSKSYQEFIDLELEKSLDRTVSPKEIEKCKLRSNAVVVDVTGCLYRCCSVYEQKYMMGSIFEYKIKDISKIKSDICYKCARTPLSWRSEFC